MRPLASSLAALGILGSACSVGNDEGYASLSATLSAGPIDGDTTPAGTGGSTSGGSVTGAASADGTSEGGGTDVGNPLCCQVGAQAGCESAVTEACVCTSQPSCCQNAWSQACVDLAIACGDPFCSEVATDDGSGSDTGQPLECDPDFAFAPASPGPGVPFSATFTDPVGLTWVGMHADGPGGASVEGGNLQITDDGPGGPFHWTYDFAGLAAGVWTFSFTHRQTEAGADIVAGTCQKQF